MSGAGLRSRNLSSGSTALFGNLCVNVYAPVFRHSRIPSESTWTSQPAAMFCRWLAWCSDLGF